MSKENFIGKHKKMIVFIVICIIAIVSISIFISSKQLKIATNNSNINSKVEYAVVESGDINLTVTGSGAIESSNTKSITTEVSAKVNKVNVAVGDKVKMMLSGSYSYIEGVISKVSDLKEQSSFGGQSQKVVVSIVNPGYTLEGINVRDVEITTQKGTKVSAVKNEEVTINAKESVKYRCPSSGKVSTVNISDGTYITKKCFY